MKKRSFWNILLVFWILFFGATLGYCRGNSDIRYETDLSKEKEIIRVQYEKVRKILGITESVSKISIRTHEGRDARGDVIEIEDGSISLELAEKTGEIVFVYSLNTANDLHKWQEKFPDSNKPIRKPTEMFALARNYVERITGKPVPENFIARTTYYDQGYLRGKWNIIWRRTLNGYPYDNDVIGIGFSDVSGKFISLVVSQTSEICPTEVKIPEEEARKIAIEYTSQHVHKFYQNAYGGQFSNPEIESIELRIVNPNYLYERKLRGLPIRPTLKSRLAYYIWVKYKVDQPKNAIKMLVWIDAATGKILGGDYTG